MSKLRTSEDKVVDLNDKETHRQYWYYRVQAGIVMLLAAVLIAIVLGLAVAVVFPPIALGEERSESPTKRVEFHVTETSIDAGQIPMKGEATDAPFGIGKVFHDVEVKCLPGILEEDPKAKGIIFFHAIGFQPAGEKQHIARTLDFFRAPMASKNQVLMQLYDVDELSIDHYKKLAMWPTRASAKAQSENQEGEIALESRGRIAFVMESVPDKAIGIKAKRGWVDPYVGVPVQWNEYLSKLVECQSDAWMAAKDTSDAMSSHEAQIMKEIMTAVFASASSKTKETPTPFARSMGKDSHMYIAVSPPIDNDGDTIEVISFKSGWTGATQVVPTALGGVTE
jgi:hypothetical protein